MVTAGYHLSDATRENPMLLCTNDPPPSQTWAVPPGVTNPLAARPVGGNNYDQSIVEDPATGDFLVTFGSQVGTTQTWQYLRYNPTNGVGAPVQIKQFTSGENLNALCLVWNADDGMWHAFATRVLSTSTNALLHYVARGGLVSGDFLGPASVTAVRVPAGRFLWEGNYQRVGNGYVALMTTSTDLSGSATTLHCMTSADGDVWDLAQTPFLSAGAGGSWDDNQIYRAGWSLSSDRSTMGVWYSARSVSNVWHVGYTQGTL